MSTVSDYFGSLVFDDRAMKASLPPSVPLLTILLSTESLREEKFLKKVISFLLILWYN